MHSLLECVAFTCIFHLVKSEQRKIEGFIVWGYKANIESFPHATFMSLTCENNNVKSRWRCGASILNQDIFLTAAHCFDACHRKSEIILSTGDVYRLKGHITQVKVFRIHQLYRIGKLEYDIALIRGRSPLTFNRKISRVAIMRNPPYFETAQLSGWGFIDIRRYLSNCTELPSKVGEDTIIFSFDTVEGITKIIRDITYSFTMNCKSDIKNMKNKEKGLSIDVSIAETKEIPTDILQYTQQQVINRNKCRKVINNLLTGTFCAQGKGYASLGDSGSGLIVRGYIQIGLVSYKNPHKSKSVIVYTDVGYYYNWIEKNAKELLCH